MSIQTSINYPLLRELKQMGIITRVGSVDSVSGPFGIKFEVIKGANAPDTRTLSKTPITNGVIGVVGLQMGTDATNMSVTTDYTISGTTFTFVTNWSAYEILVAYAHDD